MSEHDPNCPKRRFWAGFAEEKGKFVAKAIGFSVTGGAILLAAWFAWSSFTSSVSDAKQAVTPCWMSSEKNCKTDDWVRSKLSWGDNDEEVTTVAAPAEVKVVPMAAEAAPASVSEPAETVEEVGCRWYAVKCRWQNRGDNAD